MDTPNRPHFGPSDLKAEQRPGRNDWQVRKSVLGVAHTSTGPTEAQARQNWLDWYSGRTEPRRGFRARSRTGSDLETRPPSTVGDLFDRWLEHVETDLGENTRSSYAGDVRLYLRPAFGKIRLKDLSRSMCMEYFDRLKAANAYTNTIRNHHKIPLSSALSWAVEHGWIDLNPAKGIKLPAGKVGVRSLQKDDEDPAPQWIPTDEQVAHFLAVSAVRDDRLYAMWVSGFTLAPRPSELIAFQIDCLEPNAEGRLRHVGIRRKGYRQRRPGRPWKFEAPKRHSNRLQTDAPLSTLRALAAQIDFTRAWAEEHPDNPWRNLLWRNGKDEPIDPAELTDLFHTRCRWAGWPEVKANTMRHFCLSSMWDDPVIPDSRVAAWAGHKDTKMLYAHYGHRMRRTEAGPEGRHFEEALFGGVVSTVVSTDEEKAG